ncbi:hypothetical protein ACCQ05_03065 [Xanthomonas sp. NCPPB 3582]|uniref:hypothetical protein n=1 Tax=Xanthomonas sp. NCPPB 3582 TaxID=487557 RepID=UPI00355691EF
MRHAPRPVAIAAATSLCLGLLHCMPAFAQSSGKTDLDLVCIGIGERVQAHDNAGYQWDPKRHKYVERTGVDYSQTQMEGSVQIEIHDGQGRIHPPKRLLPPLKSGGHDGWWPLHDLRVGADRIQASYKLNGMNSPTVDIDRRSGRLTLTGIEKFEGHCSAVDPGKNQF